ncbi:endolytic transglycosylase MltG [Demequina oxidasica]|uniref:endolytic transglycosylase MltG n=1 Tax=Demequina oxidasica TaxID=676199 RepID=UPI0007865BF2|nr:endolytic transglycosylase MltG [Demequina oxidasica]
MTDLFEAESTTTTSLDMRRLQRKQRRATRRKWTLIASAFGLVIFAVGVNIAWNFAQTLSPAESTEIADYDGAGQGVVQVVINPGDTGTEMAQALYDAGVVASPEAFVQEWNTDSASSGIIPGYYFMHKEMKASFALQSLLDPDNRDLRTLTVPEGLRVEAYYEKIAALTEYSKADVEEAAKNTTAIGLPDEANGNLEGWLFASTYEFNPGVTPTDVLAEMVKQTVKQLDAQGVAPEDRERILTVASLVEREAKLDEDRPKIAEVVYNRLDKDMKLEFDSTVKYVSPTKGVFTSDEERDSDSPYNTYKFTGLPPGPIAGPGAASIAAAVNPEPSDNLFFVTVNLNSGETAYAKTFDEHQKNVKVLQAWVKENADESASPSPEADAN